MMLVLATLYAEVASGVKVVAREERERCRELLATMHELLAALEARTSECSHDHIVSRLRAQLGPEPVEGRP